MTRPTPSKHYKTIADIPAKRSVTPEKPAEGHFLSPPHKRPRTVNSKTAPPILDKPSSHIASGNKYSALQGVTEVTKAVKAEIGNFRANSVELLQHFQKYYADHETDCGSQYPFLTEHNLFESPAKEWCDLPETKQYDPIARFITSIKETQNTSVAITILGFDRALLDKSELGYRPDVAPYPSELLELRFWTQLLFLAEVKSNLNDVIWQVSRYVRVIVGEDPRRIFMYGIVFHSSYLNFVRVDRGGVLVTRSLELAVMQDAIIAVNCLRGLLYLNSSEPRQYLRGYDVSFSLSLSTPPENQYEFHESGVIFTIHGKSFSLLKSIVWREELRGRATRVFTALAIDPGTTFTPLPQVDVNGWTVDSARYPPIDVSSIVILRFVHRLRSRDIEPIIVQEISGFNDKGTPLFGLPKFGPRFVNGHFDTKEIRAEERLDDATSDDRIYTLQIILSVGKPLDRASSVRQIVVGLHDATLGLRHLWRLRYVHRDVSFGNILLYDEPWDVQFYFLDMEKEVLPTDRKATAFLSDFDVAVKWPLDPNVIHHRRTGTPEFMANALVQKLEVSTPHTPVYDLESIFWVLIWAVALHLRRNGSEDAQRVIDHLQDREKVVDGRAAVIRELRFHYFGGRTHPAELEKFGDFFVNFANLIDAFQMFQFLPRTPSEKELVSWIDASFAKVISLFESIERTTA